MRTALWPETTQDQHRKEMEFTVSYADRYNVCVCEDQGSLVGFAEVLLREWAEGCTSSPVGYLEGWYVVSRVRHAGVGKMLLKAAEDWARSRGCTEMASDTELGNEVSEAAHLELGFQVAAQVIAFRKDLGPSTKNETPMKLRSISMITLGVRDLGVSAKFYETLGFPRMESPPEVAFFTLKGTWLSLYGREALAADAMVSADGQGFRSFTLSHNVQSESEVDQVIQQAVEAGATLAKEPQKTSWGGYNGYFKDPDGHLWEIAHNPFFWVGPRDDV